MATFIKGMSWGVGTQDSDGYREYKLVVTVGGDITDGPANAMATPGLPLPYSPWLVQGDVDIWVWCRWNIECQPKLDKEPNQWWDLTFTFSNKPIEGRWRQLRVENPLLELPIVTGSYAKYQEEANIDMNGVAITTTSWELFRGPQIEFDASRMSVKIEMPFSAIGSLLVSKMVDCVNQYPLWGLPARSIKMNSPTWKRAYWGYGNEYYIYTLDFEIRVDPSTGLGAWDRYLLDEGTKVLNGHWDKPSGNYVLDNVGGEKPDRYNPQHFKKFQDRQGNCCKVVLNLGLPSAVVLGVGSNEVQSISFDQPPGGGTFKLAWQGIAEAGTLSWDSTADDAFDELETIEELEGNISVTGGPLPASTILVTYVNDLAKAPQPLLGLFDSNLTFNVTPTLTDIGDFEQLLSFSPDKQPTAGTFKMSYDDSNFSLGSSLPYNATAGAVQSYIETIQPDLVGHVTCTDGPLPGDSVTITYDDIGMQLLTADDVDSTCTFPANVVSINEVTKGNSASAPEAPGYIFVQKYYNADFTLLGIPLVL